MRKVFVRPSTKLVWTVVLLILTVCAFLFVSRLSKHNLFATIAVKDVIFTALLSKSDTLVHVEQSNLRSVKLYTSCETRIGAGLDRSLDIFTDLCDVMTGRSDGCHYSHPDVVHYVKLADKDVIGLTFQEFLSILSMHKFYKPSKIVIHSNAKKFTGKYWNLTQNLSTPVKIEYVDRVRKVGQRQKPYYITHEADVLKVKTIIRDGGIFSDFDVIMINGAQFRAKQKLGECVIGSDTDPCTRLCAGFVSCIPNSSFAQDWFEGYQLDYVPYLWVYNAGTVPSNLLRRCPNCYDVHVDRTISFITASEKWLKPKGVDWKSRNVIHYMNYMFGVSSKDITPEALFTRFNNTAIGDLFMHVLGDHYREIK